MQKELGERVNYEIPEEAERAYALAQRLASSQEMPGQASMQAMMDLQAQKAYGNASRAAISSQDLLGVATALGEQGQENQLNLGIQAAQNYQQRQQALYGAMQNMAGYQDKVTADRQRDWYERAEAAAQMKEGGLQNLMGTAQSAGQMGMMMGGGAGMGGSGGGTTGSMADSFTKASDLPSSIDFSPMSGKNLMKTMMQNSQVGQVPPPVAAGQAQFGNIWSNFNNALQFQQNPSYSPGAFNPTSGAIFPRLGIAGFTGERRDLMPTTSFKDVMKLYNTFY
jgi:hypothetical protein